MKLELRPQEFLDLYEVLIITKDRTDLSIDEALMSRFRDVVLTSLEKQEEEINSARYKVWTDQESKKIEALEEVNNRLVEEVVILKKD